MLMASILSNCPRSQERDSIARSIPWANRFSPLKIYRRSAQSPFNRCKDDKKEGGGEMTAGKSGVIGGWRDASQEFLQECDLAEENGKGSDGSVMPGGSDDVSEAEASQLLASMARPLPSAPGKNYTHRT